MWESGLFLNCNVYWDCPTNCRYCFSMLNRRSHNVVGKSATDKALGTLVSLVNKVFSPRYDETDPLQFFLREGYPVMVSNNSDPLSALEVEHGYTRQYLDVLADCGSPVNLLSKWQGWKHLDQDAYIETFKRNPNLWCSITITADNDASLRKWEPGAPTLDERLAIIRQLTGAGIQVDVRVVPFIFGDSFPNGDWDDPETYRPFIQRVKDAGAFGLAVAPIDFGIYDAKSCDATCKRWVSANAWSASDQDKPWHYYLPDVDIWRMVSKLWYQEARAAGLRCGVHQGFASTTYEASEPYGVVVGPEWMDRYQYLSWVNTANVLRQMQEDYNAPVIASSRQVAAYTCEGHRHAEQRFRWDKWRDCIPYPIGNVAYQAHCLHDPDGATFEKVMRMQLDTVTKWSDSIWCDIATAPVSAGDDTDEQVADDKDGVMLSYDANRPRSSWASCLAGRGWNGRTQGELADAVLVDGSPAWINTDER